MVARNEEFKKIEKLQEKAIRIISFLPLNATVEKHVWNEYTKTKGLHHASQYLICKRLLLEWKYPR